MSEEATPRSNSDAGPRGLQVSIFPDLAKTLTATAKLTRSKREKDKQRAYRKNKLFRRIEADIKERERKRVPGKLDMSTITCKNSFNDRIIQLYLYCICFSIIGRPEHYVDRDRMIATSFYGQVDIRQQMLKQRSFLTRRAHTSGN